MIELLVTIVSTILTHVQTLKKSDVVLDVNGTNFEAAISINDWVFELKIGTPVNDQLVNQHRLDELIVIYVCNTLINMFPLSFSHYTELLHPIAGSQGN